MNETTTKVLDALYLDGKVHVAELVNSLPDREKEELIDPLVLILKSVSDNDRANAIHVLGLLGPLASRAVPDIIAAPDGCRMANVRWEVTTALPKIGATYAVPELIKNLGDVPDDSPISRATKSRNSRIIEHLAAFGPAASSAAPHLTRYLGSYVAEEALGKMGPDAVPAVLDQVMYKSDGRQPWVYSNSADVLAAVGAAASLPLADAFDKARTTEARLSILRIFRQGPTPSKRLKLDPALYAVLIEKCFADEDLRLPTEMHVILNYRGAELIPALRVTMSNASVSVQVNSAAVLLRLLPDDTEALEKLVTHLASGDQRVRLSTLKALSDSGAKNNGSPHGLVQIPRDSTQTLAGRCSPSEKRLVDALMKALQDPVSEVRKLATECLAQSGFLGIILHQMMASMSIVEFKPDEIETSLPAMPTLEFIKQSLQTSNEVMISSAQQIAQPKFLRKHILIEVSGYSFGSRGLGTHNSGLYAFDGKQLMYLNGPDGNKNIGEVFRTELMKLDQIDPVELAWFFNGTVLEGFTLKTHRVVESSAVPTIEQRNCSDSKDESLITRPSLTATENQDWIINFWTYCQWEACLGVSRSLHQHRIVVSQQFDVTYEERLSLQSFTNY